jgi:hypothetical protein
LLLGCFALKVKRTEGEKQHSRPRCNTVWLCFCSLLADCYTVLVNSLVHVYRSTRIKGRTIQVNQNLSKHHCFPSIDFLLHYSSKPEIRMFPDSLAYRHSHSYHKEKCVTKKRAVSIGWAYIHLRLTLIFSNGIALPKTRIQNKTRINFSCFISEDGLTKEVTLSHSFFGCKQLEWKQM